MVGDDGFDFGVDFAAAEGSEESAGGPRAAKLGVAALPIPELRFGFGVCPRPLRRRKRCAAAPRFRRKPGTKTFLDLAKLLVERIDA